MADLLPSEIEALRQATAEVRGRIEWRQPVGADCHPCWLYYDRMLPAERRLIVHGRVVFREPLAADVTYVRTFADLCHLHVEAVEAGSADVHPS